MKAVITAGGRSTRLRPITNNLNKHLIPIANQPMIYYAIEKIIQAGITDIGIIVNPDHKDLFNILGSGSRWSANFTYIVQSAPLGLAHALKITKQFTNNEPFIFYLGDNLTSIDLKPLITKFQTNKLNSLLALTKIKDPTRFGVPEIHNDRIIKVEEKPRTPKSEYAVTGIYLYDKNVYEACDNIKPSSRNEFEISDIHTYLAEHGYQVGFEIIQDWWKDTGTSHDLLEGNQFILDKFLENHTDTQMLNLSPNTIIQGRVKILSGARMDGNVIIRGPVVIGYNCNISNSYIGPYTSIGNSSTINNAEIENSILFDQVSIGGPIKIVNSIIGYNAQILSSQHNLPSGHKFIIGENSIVDF